MRKITVILALVLMAGCTKPPSEWETKSAIDLSTVNGLEDCSYHRIYTGANHLHVIRCPKSTVSVQRAGKNPTNTVTDSE